MAFIPILALAACVFFALDAFPLTAMVSAGLAMPESAARLAMRQWAAQALPELPDETQTTVSATKEDNADAAQALAVDSNTKNTPLTAIPADIKALIAKEESNKKTEKSLGEIVEIDCSKSGATSVYQNVRVRNVTETKSLNIERTLSQKPELQVKDKAKPAVLIFHTHTTESYQILDRDFYTTSEARSNDPALNMVRVGEEIAEQLEKAGYTVIHDKTIHDKNYTGAYGRSRETVQKHLKEHPEIQMVLDVHRDAMHRSDGSKLKPTVMIDGKKAAQIMIITGAQEGAVTNFPDWEKNLRFALQVQRKLETLYPGLTRPVLFSQRLYTMDLHPCNILLEMGSDVNTLDEAAYSGRLAGYALAQLLQEYTK